MRFDDDSILYKCHRDQATYVRCGSMTDPMTHFCGDWNQAEPFAEEDVLELLTKDMP
jgi:hypothetical protein